MRNYVMYATSMFLSLVFALLYHILATHFFTPDEYGLLSIWLAPIVGTAIFAVGYQAYVARQVAKHRRVYFPREFLILTVVFALLACFQPNFTAYIFLPFIFLLSYYRGIIQNFRKFELAFNIFFEAGLRIALLSFLIEFGVLGALLSFTIPFLLAALPALKNFSFGKFDGGFLPFSASTFLIFFPTNFSIMLVALTLPLDLIAKLAASLNLAKAILLISSSSFMEYLVEKSKRSISKFFPLLIILGVATPFMVFPQITRIFGVFYLLETEFRILCLAMVVMSILFLYVNELWSKDGEKEGLYFLGFFLLFHVFMLLRARTLLEVSLAYLFPAVVTLIAIILKVEILKKPCAG